MLKTSDFKLIFTPIRELLGFSPKLKHIYFSYLTISEIFSWFEEHFCLQILLLLLLLLAAIKSLRGVVVKRDSLLAVLILVFCEIEISAFRRPSQISNTDVLPRMFPRIFKKNAQKKICILEYNMSDFKFFWRNPSETSAYRCFSEISAYRRLSQNFSTTFQKTLNKKYVS